MRLDKVFLLMFCAGAAFAFAMSVWGGGAEWLYRKYRDSEWTWFWLDVLGIERSPHNCVKFIRIAHFIGLVMAVVWTAIILAEGK